MEKEQSYLWKYLKAIKNKFYLPLEESQNDEFPFFPLVFFHLLFVLFQNSNPSEAFLKFFFSIQRR